MKQNDDSSCSRQSTSNNSRWSSPRSNTARSRSSFFRVQNPRLRPLEEKNEAKASPSRTLPTISRQRNEPEKFRPVKKGKEDKLYANSDFVVSECWNGEVPVKLVDLFRDNKADEDYEAGAKRRKIGPEEEINVKLSSTNEFHVLSEVQKAKILSTVEDAIKKIANKDSKEYYGRDLEGFSTKSSVITERTSDEKLFCKKFLMPWISTKVIELILCHIVQLTFLSEESYFDRKNEFLPIVVTYYLTLFVILLSLVVRITCFSYTKTQNPCYFMGVLSSTILALTTTLGILVMLISLDYYKSFLEILVLIFIIALLFSLFGELCLCYMEVKNIWRRLDQMDQSYVE